MPTDGVDTPPGNSSLRSQPTWKGTAVLVAVPLIILGLLSLAGRIAYHLPLSSTWAFYACIGLAFVPSGGLLLALARFRSPDPVAHAALGLGLGSTLVPLLYEPLKATGIGDGLLLAVLSLVLPGWISARFLTRRRALPLVPITVPDLACIGAVLAILLGLLHLSHFTDTVLLPDGFEVRTSHLTESVFHLGLVNALADQFPPPSLFASGTGDFAFYHFGMHLQIELVARLTGIEPLLLTSFYFPFLYFVLLAFLAFVFVRGAGGSLAIASVGAVLVFGSDFSFVPGLILDRPEYPWTLYFPTTIWSVFTLNGYLPALIALFVSLIALDRYLRGHWRGGLVVFALCTLAAFDFKTTMGLQMSAAAMLAGAVLYVWKPRWREAAWLALTGLPLLVGLIVLGAGRQASSEAVEVAIAPLNLLRSTLETLGMGGMDLIWLPVVLPLLLLASFGVRAAGVPAVVRAWKSGDRNLSTALFIACFFVVGYGVAETFAIGASGGQDNSGWFQVQSLMAAWFALFLVLARPSFGGARRSVVLALVVFLAIPTTAQFLWLRYDDAYVHYDIEAVQVIEALRSTAPNSVVLHPVNRNEPSLSANFAGRQSVISPFRSFLPQGDMLDRRVADVEEFFAAGTSRTRRQAILAEYAVDYVYLPTREESVMQDIPSTRPVFSGQSLLLYQVDPEGL